MGVFLYRRMFDIIIQYWAERTPDKTAEVCGVYGAVWGGEMKIEYLFWCCIMCFLSGSLVDDIICSYYKRDRIKATLLFVIAVIFAILNMYLAIR